MLVFVLSILALLFSSNSAKSCGIYFASKSDPTRNERNLPEPKDLPWGTGPDRRYVKMFPLDDKPIPESFIGLRKSGAFFIVDGKVSHHWDLVGGSAEPVRVHHIGNLGSNLVLVSRFQSPAKEGEAGVIRVLGIDRGTRETVLHKVLRARSINNVFVKGDRSIFLTDRGIHRYDRYEGSSDSNSVLNPIGEVGRAIVTAFEGKSEVFRAELEASGLIDMTRQLFVRSDKGFENKDGEVFIDIVASLTNSKEHMAQLTVRVTLTEELRFVRAEEIGFRSHEEVKEEYAYRPRQSDERSGGMMRWRSPFGPGRRDFWFPRGGTRPRHSPRTTLEPPW